MPQLPTIFNIINCHELCTGIDKTDDLLLHEIERHTKYFSVQVKEDSVSRNKIISKSCTVVATTGQPYCKSCSALKKCMRRRFRRQQSLSGSVHVNTKYFSRRQLEENLTKRCKEVKAAKQKSQFWMKKFSSESIMLEKDQSIDLATILSGIHGQPVSENMKLLIAQQQKALQVKGSSGHRWHPR